MLFQICDLFHIIYERFFLINKNDSFSNWTDLVFKTDSMIQLTAYWRGRLSVNYEFWSVLQIYICVYHIYDTFMVLLILNL